MKIFSVRDYTFFFDLSRSVAPSIITILQHTNAYVVTPDLHQAPCKTWRKKDVLYKYPSF
jgi:hypothetical protein